MLGTLAQDLKSPVQLPSARTVLVLPIGLCSARYSTLEVPLGVPVRYCTVDRLSAIGDQLRLILPISGGHSSNLPMRDLCPSILPIQWGHPSIVPTGGGRSSIVPIR